MAGTRPARRTRRAFEKLGFAFIDTDGSYCHYRAPNDRTITVDLGHRGISEASLRKTCALADVAWSDVEKQY